MMLSYVKYKVIYIVIREGVIAIYYQSHVLQLFP